MCNKICKEINMVSVKRVLSGILVLTISILIGCSKVKEDNEGLPGVLKLHAVHWQ